MSTLPWRDGFRVPSGAAHLFFPRQTEKGLKGEGPLGSNGWSLLMTCVARVVAVVAGLLLLRQEG